LNDPAIQKLFLYSVQSEEVRNVTRHLFVYWVRVSGYIFAGGDILDSDKKYKACDSISVSVAYLRKELTQFRQAN
jgi:hypothetical protein